LENPLKHVLLLSNSIQYGKGYLDHAEAEIRSFFGNVRRVLFVPYAMFDHEAYANKTRNRLAAMGYDAQSAHAALDARRAVEHAEGVFIGGGNTFRLLKTLYDEDLLETIRRRVEEGMPYLGSSAGSVVACPTLKTTNDMPIVQPPSFTALGLVSFQINPHYIDPDPSSTHMGETREERLLQYLEDNDTPVVALREGAIVHLEGGVVTLKGIRGARVFRKGDQPEEVPVGARLNL
jgi:dipeptidase E